MRYIFTVCFNFCETVILFRRRDKSGASVIAMEKNVSNNIARGILKLLELHDVDTKKIPEKCGISSYELESNGGRLSEGRCSLYVLVNIFTPPNNHDFASSRCCSHTLNHAK